MVRKGSAQRFDAIHLARERGAIEGSVDPHALSRIAEQLTGAGSVAWRIEGTSDPAGRPALQIGLRGSVTLECQRCLDDFAWPVDVTTEVLLARNEAELATLDADSSLEVVLADGPLDPLAL
ncbi:MAG TPA: YceD family protein, partial [Casimicrobiaceae bacterium]